MYYFLSRRKRGHLLNTSYSGRLYDNENEKPEKAIKGGEPGEEWGAGVCQF